MNFAKLLFKICIRLLSIFDVLILRLNLFGYVLLTQIRLTLGKIGSAEGYSSTDILKITIGIGVLLLCGAIFAMIVGDHADVGSKILRKLNEKDTTTRFVRR